MLGASFCHDLPMTSTTVPGLKLFLVGGAVRDELLGTPSKDLDFSVELDAEFVGGPVEVGFEQMKRALAAAGFVVFTEDPEFATLRAHFPKSHPEFGRTTADFVLCRKDGPSSDGRRPDFVTVGTLADDLARRDFSVNALARDETGELVDLHGGMADLDAKVLRFVGDPMTRLREDGLRALRAVRFAVTKGFELDGAAKAALLDPETATLLGGVSDERKAEELKKALKADTVRTMEVLMHECSPEFVDAVFSSGRLRLTASLKD